MIFMDACTQCWGAYMRDSQISGTWTHAERKLHIFGLELKEVILTLHHWVIPSYGHYHILTQGGTHSHTMLCLVVGLFLWLQTQDIAIRTRHIPSCLTVIADHLSQPNQPISTKSGASTPK